MKEHELRLSRRLACSGMTSSHFTLLRGLGRESGHWLEFPDQLQAVFPNAYILKQDLPGFGELREIKFPLTIAQATDQIRAFRQKSEPAGLRVLIAISLGGMIAADWIFRYPQDFDFAVLINTSFRGLSPILDRLRPMAIVQLARAAIHTDPLEREKVILSLVSHHGMRREWALPRWVEIAQKHPIHPANFLLQLQAAGRFRIPRGRPEIPVLILSSRHDQLANSKCSVELAQRWRSEHFVHPTAGHDLTLDDGPWVAQRVSAWLTRPTPEQPETL